MHATFICRGAQMLGVSLGCKLHQDIYHDLDVDPSHRDQREHPIVILPGEKNILRDLYGLSSQKNSVVEILAPSEHHQALVIDSKNKHILPLAYSDINKTVLEAYAVRQPGKRNRII